MAETVASGIASAAQAFAALAPIPFVGVALGTAAAAVITAAMGMRVAQIEKQKPIKPDNPRQTSSYNPSASETTNAESLPSAP